MLFDNGVQKCDANWPYPLNDGLMAPYCFKQRDFLFTELRLDSCVIVYFGDSFEMLMNDSRCR